MKASRLIIAISVLVLIFGGVALSKTLGLWETENAKVPSKISEGDFAGEYNPWDIRGSYTFGDVENNFDIDSKILARAFGIKDDNPADFALKELEEMYGAAGFPLEIGTGSVRYFVALWKGYPIEEEELDGLTVVSLNILKENEKITEEEYQALLVDAINLNGEYQRPEGVDPSDSEEHTEQKKITGNTTVGQALDMGIPEDILAEYVDIGDKNVLIKNLIQGQEQSFSEIREILNGYIPAE